MEKQSIVLDLDGVIANIALSLDDHITHTGYPDFVDYTDWLISDSSDEEAMKIFNNPLFWKNMKPYEDAWHQINYWFEMDIDVHIVTARRCPASIEQTQPWLDYWRLSTSPPVFTNIHEKHEVIQNLNPRFVVEDNPTEVEILLSEGVNAFLRKQWYNKKYWSKLPTIDTLYDLDWN
jgi:hypothetical protein